MRALEERNNSLHDALRAGPKKSSNVPEDAHELGSLFCGTKCRFFGSDVQYAAVRSRQLALRYESIRHFSRTARRISGRAPLLTCGDIGLDVRSGDLSVAPGVTASPFHSGLHHWRRAIVTERFCARDLVGARCCPDGFRYWVRVNLGPGRFRDNRLR